jgi:hypothetical protein
MTNKKGSVRGGRKEEEEVEIDMNSGFYSTDSIFMNGALIILVICGESQSHLIQTD